MAIPEKAAFEASIDYLKTCNAGLLQPLFTLEVFNDSSSADALALVRLATKLRQERYDEADRDKVISWLNSQDGYVRAVKRLPPGPRRASKKSSAGEIKDIHQYYFEALHKISKIEHPERRQRRFDKAVASLLDTYEAGGNSTWQWGLVKSLYEYHYTDHASDIVNNMRQLSSRIDKAIAGLEALRQVSKDGFAHVQFLSMQNAQERKEGQQVQLVDDDIDRRLQLLASMKTVDPDQFYPLKRIDDTAKERLFVFRMAGFNHMAWGGSRAPAIACLMEIEGFRNQIDERNIERQCAATSKKERHLFDVYESLTAVA
ncbi:hypothetical protein GCM10027093_21310 [Paraburkholderia jirisanensis]